MAQGQDRRAAPLRKGELVLVWPGVRSGRCGFARATSDICHMAGVQGMYVHAGVATDGEIMPSGFYALDHVERCPGRLPDQVGSECERIADELDDLAEEFAGGPTVYPASKLFELAARLREVSR